MQEEQERHALLIGISNYSPTGGYDPLILPEQDADMLEKLLENPEIGAFHNVVNIKNKEFQDLRDTIVDFLDKLKFKDLVLLYFAGHGDLGKDGKYYFIAENTVKGKLASRGIGAEWLLSLLEECKAQTQVVILDCCYSGEFLKLLKGRGKGNPSQQMVQQLKGERGRTVLASSSAFQQSWEDLEKKISVFSSKLIEAIGTGIADGFPDQRPNGNISIYEIDRYVKTQLKGKPQEPVSILGGEVDIAKNPRFKGTPVEERAIFNELMEYISLYENKKTNLIVDLKKRLESYTERQRSSFIQKFLNGFHEKPIDQIYVISKVFPLEYGEFFAIEVKRAFFRSLIIMFDGSVLDEYDEKLASQWSTLHQGKWKGSSEELMEFFQEFSFGEEDARIMIKKGVFPWIKFQTFAIVGEHIYDDPLGSRDEVRGAEAIINPKNPGEDGFYTAITTGEYYSHRMGIGRYACLVRFDLDGGDNWRSVMPGGNIFAWTEVIPLENSGALLVAQASDGSFIRAHRYDEFGSEDEDFWDLPHDRGIKGEIYLSGTANSGDILWIIGEKIDKRPHLKSEIPHPSPQLYYAQFEINPDGHLVELLEKTWDPGHAIHPSKCTSDGDGGIFLTGYCDLPNKDKSSKDAKERLFLAHIKRDGSVDQFRHFKTELGEIGVGIDYDGENLHVIGFLSISEPPRYYLVMLWKFDQEFNMLNRYLLTSNKEEKIEFDYFFEGHLGRLEPYIDIQIVNYPSEHVLVAFPTPTNMGDACLAYFDAVRNELVNSYVFDKHGNHDSFRRIIRMWYGGLFTTGGTSRPYKDHPQIQNLKWKCNFKISPYRPYTMKEASEGSLYGRS